MSAPDPSPSRRRVHVVVSGLVQGVGFRFASEREARKLGLSGWVRNLPDGSVEALVEGTPDVVQKFLDWCHVGPSAARVTSVRHRDEPIDRPLTGFGIRY